MRKTNLTTNFNPSQLSIIKTYISVAKKHQNYPTRQTMKEAGVSKDKIEYHFGNLFSLKKAAKEYSPDSFNKILDDTQFNPQRLEELKREVSDYKRFVITTAVTGCQVHKGFYDALQVYCKKNDACLLIMLCSEPTKTKHSNKWEVPAELAEKHNIVFSDLALNDNLYLSTIKTQAKQLLPLTGLNRLTSEFGSCIIASPKQQLKMIPSSNTKIPKALMTTGAITSPDYTPEKYLSERLAALGHRDHILGAVVIELIDDQYFFFRQIQADSRGDFYDLDCLYSREGVTKSTIEYLVAGDWHTGETNPKVKETLCDITKALKPKKFVVHDLYTGASTCHFDINKSLTLANKFEHNELNLEQELANVAKELNALEEQYEEIIIVKSNHDERLEKYLESNRYINEPHNMKISLRLAYAMIEGNNPLRWAMENIFKIKNPQKFKWLNRDDEYKFKGIVLSNHGDIGGNGAKGSPMSLESCCPNAVIGHFHSPQIIRNLWVVGTSTHLKLNYNGKGPSSWANSSVIIHKNGQRQMLTIINGKYRL